MNSLGIGVVNGFCPTINLCYSKSNKQIENKPESSSLTFGYSSPLKTYWRKGKLPTVKKCFYGDTLSQNNISLEHLKPHSKGGKTCLTNLVLASREKNNARGNNSITEFFDKEKAIEYLKQFIDVKLKDFNGNKYIKGIVKTLRDMGVDI